MDLFGSSNIAIVWKLEMKIGGMEEERGLGVKVFRFF